MNIKDFLRLMIKLFGLFSLISALFTFLPQVAGLISNFSTDYFDWSSTIGFIFIGLSIICLFLWLTFNPDFLIEKLKLDKGFDQQIIPFEKLNASVILKIGCIVVGGLLFLNNLAEFITGCFYFLEESIQTSVQGMFETTFRQSSKIDLAINFINLIIGYVLITSHNSFVRFLLKEGQPDQEQVKE